MLKNQYNKEGNREGYWEIYWDDKIWFKGNYKNGKPLGYWECYNIDGTIRFKDYVI